jgi:hypothetical protein
MTSGVIVRTMCMKFQQDGSSVSVELRSGIHVGVMAKCLLSTKKKKRLTFEIIMYCVVRRSYVNLLMKFSDGVPVIFIKIIVLGKYDVS